VNLIQAQMWNVGTWALMIRESRKWEDPISGRVPMQGVRGGAACSSEEGLVMGLERRGCIVRLLLRGQPVMGGIFEESEAVLY
jgi:hypothetical protein